MDHATSSFVSPPEMNTGMQSQVPPEILLTIFENVKDQRTVRNLRLVSTQFEELVTPIWCREVVLTPDIVAQYSRDRGWTDHSMLQVQRTVHTRRVIIKKELDWRLVNRLLSTLKNLQSLLWIEWPTTNARDLERLLAFQQIRDEFPRLEYQVEAFRAVAWRITRLRDNPDSRYEDYLAMRRHYSGGFLSGNYASTWLSTSRLTSLKFVDWDEYSYQYISPLLLGNHQLKTLHIAGKHTGTMIDERGIGNQDSLPPIKELSLQNYDWDHSPMIINSFWNWTNLTVLELKRVPILHFLYTVPAENLAQLQVFNTDGFCFDNSDWDLATRSLSDLISKIWHLYELSVTCNVGDQSLLLSLLGHGATLHTLELRCYHDPFATHLSDRVSQKRVNSVQLSFIQVVCPHLTTLALYYRPSVSGVEGLHLTAGDYALTAFRNLRRLRVYVWTCISTDEGSDEPVMAINYRNARGWNERLASTKQGAKFEHIILHTEVWEVPSNRFVDATFAAEVTVTYGDL